MKKVLQNTFLLSLLLAVVAFHACKKEKLEVISGFSYKVDASDFRKVSFTNASQNYTSVAWDFGDGSPVSNEVNPVHTYLTTGTFKVKLTAINEDVSDVSTQDIVISDPDAELTKLVGIVSKTWKLLRVPNANTWPLEVGPISKTEVWWAQGRANDEIANRPCIMNDEWIFSRDGKMEYKTNGDYWAEGGVFLPDNICTESTPGNMKGPNGEDLSAFGDGTHSFILTGGSNPTLEVVGLGAFIGLPKIGTDTEVKLPQTSVKLDILKLYDGTVDTLILESKWKFNASNPTDDAYWKIVLVSYDNPGEEPPIPSPKPKVGFTYTTDLLKVTFTNTSTNADSYLWEFGDGATSTETSPEHTYASAGVYKVRLTATNAHGSAIQEQEFTLSTGTLSEAELIGGPWKIRNAVNSIFVGPALGSNAWWGVPANFLDGTTTGTDDWTCILNDEFIFSAGGVYQYKTNGDARNDGYMGTPNGCWSDAQVAASGNGAAFGSATHSFTFTPAANGNRPVITLTNGTTNGAFIGFYKGYYGGENTDGTKPPNGGSSTNRYEVMSYVNDGTKETLTLSVDISANKDGSAAWSVVLVR